VPFEIPLILKSPGNRVRLLRILDREIAKAEQATILGKEATSKAGIDACLNDPLRFVQTAFPWGEAGTPLERYEGPDEWQVGLLSDIRDKLAQNQSKSARSQIIQSAIQTATASGHGVGKSALVAWLILWAMTMPDTKGIVTANTDTQLRTKTWPECAKWYQLCICKHWWVMTATSLYSANANHEKTWRIDAIPWSVNNTEAFAGLHNQGRRILLIFDEASAIPDIIWEVSEGMLSDADTQIVWAVFGNPTRSTGRFKECFGRFRHRWIRRQVDSRTVKITNKAQIDQWQADYGEDSDFFRVRVRGVFPRAGSTQFIGSDLVDMAMSTEREYQATVMDPLVMGVDCARFGDDQSVIYVRRGRDARTIPPFKFRGVDNVFLAARVSEIALELKVDAIFVDEGGLGSGVVDHLRWMQIRNMVPIQFGAKADRHPATDSGPVSYANKRAEMWGMMKDWLKGAVLPYDQELYQDLIGVEYGYVLRDGRDAILLEKKEDMKKRGMASPDAADALALTFAYPVAPSDHTKAFSTGTKHQVDYNPMAAAYNPSTGQEPSGAKRSTWMPHGQRR
jgi:hypothetical protein